MVLDPLDPPASRISRLAPTDLSAYVSTVNIISTTVTDGVKLSEIECQGFAVSHMNGAAYVESSKVDSVDGEVGIEIDSLASLIWVARVAGPVVESFVSNRNEVIGIDRLYKSRHLRGPVGNSRCRARSACDTIAR